MGRWVRSVQASLLDVPHPRTVVSFANSTRKLLGVTDHNHLIPPCDSPDRIVGANLRGLVEKHQSEPASADGEVLRHRQRAHEKARLELGKQVRDRGQELALSANVNENLAGP